MQGALNQESTARIRQLAPVDWAVNPCFAIFNAIGIHLHLVSVPSFTHLRSLLFQSLVARLIPRDRCVHPRFRRGCEKKPVQQKDYNNTTSTYISIATALRGLTRDFSINHGRPKQPHVHVLEPLWCTSAIESAICTTINNHPPQCPSHKLHFGSAI